MRGGGWDRPKANFQPGDYVLLKQKQKNCLQPPARPHILRIVELRPSGIVILEGSDAARTQRQIKDVAQSPLPILDLALHPYRFYRGPTLHFRVCEGRAQGPKTLVTRDITSGASTSRYYECLRMGGCVHFVQVHRGLTTVVAHKKPLSGCIWSDDRRCRNLTKGSTPLD